MTGAQHCVDALKGGGSSLYISGWRQPKGQNTLYETHNPQIKTGVSDPTHSYMFKLGLTFKKLFISLLGCKCSKGGGALGPCLPLPLTSPALEWTCGITREFWAQATALTQYINITSNLQQK